jgi:hypothetical protein
VLRQVMRARRLLMAIAPAVVDRALKSFLSERPAVRREAKEDWEVTDLLLKRSRIALNEVYDVVCEGRIVGRIMLTNVPAPYWSWTLAYSFHEGRTPTRGHEATIEAAMAGVREKLAQGMSGRPSPQ